MAAPTAGNIVSLALLDAGVIGVGQTPNAEDSANALTRMNWMIDQWARQRWLVYALQDSSVTSTGATSYTVGPGGDINIASRPDRLETAFLRQLTPGPPNQIDYPLEILQSWEDYVNIALKSLQSFPEFIFYDSAYPTARIFPWPVPQPTIYAVHILTKVVLSELTSLASNIVFPPEYYAALHTNLAVVLRDAYDLPPKPVLVARAKVALNTMRKANTQIGRLGMPPGLLRDGIYDFFSDRIRGM